MEQITFIFKRRMKKMKKFNLLTAAGVGLAALGFIFEELAGTAREKDMFNRLDARIDEKLDLIVEEADEDLEKED